MPANNDDLNDLLQRATRKVESKVANNIVDQIQLLEKTLVEYMTAAAERKLVMYPNKKILSTKCAVVDRSEILNDDFRTLVADMILTMQNNKGLGLAAPQVGVLKRLFVMQLEDGPLAIINPVITSRHDNTTTNEGCLSFPGIFMDVKRSKTLNIAYENINGEPMVANISGIPAIIVQHEYDHLNGKLFIDRVSSAKKYRVISKNFLKNL